MLAEQHLQMLRYAHPVPHPDRTCKLDISLTALLVPLFRCYPGKLKEPLDTLHCKILDSSPSLHALAKTFLNKKVQGVLNINKQGTAPGSVGNILWIAASVCERKITVAISEPWCT